jgi:hypothetical protein
MANAGGGVIVVGRAPPAAEIIGALATHLGEPWEGVDVVDGRAIVVAARTASPLIFDATGVVYFRHGARTAPATAKDMARFAAREATRLRRELVDNVRKVARAPRGAEVIVVTPHAGPAEPFDRFRVVDDPDAPAVARTDFDVTHPYRQKELINAVNARIGETVVGPYEILCVRRVHGVDEREDFFHRPKFGSPQYSDALVAWLVDQIRGDPEFLPAAKAAYRATR